MEKVAALLIAYGQDFDYENKGSEGETITAHTLEVEVSLRQGVATFKGPSQDEATCDTEKTRCMSYMVELVEDECIAATT